MMKVESAMLLIPSWMAGVLVALWKEWWESLQVLLNVFGIFTTCFSSCITVAGGFVSYCLGYTTGYKGKWNLYISVKCYSHIPKDIDIFCTKEAFAKIISKVGDLPLGIRLVRLAHFCIIFSFQFSLAPPDLAKTTYWDHSFQVYNVYQNGVQTKLQVTQEIHRHTLSLR